MPPSHLGLLYRLVVLTDYGGWEGAGGTPDQGQLLVGGFRSGRHLALNLIGFNLEGTRVLMPRPCYLPRGWAGCSPPTASRGVQQLNAVYPSPSLGFRNAFFAAELIFMAGPLAGGWRREEPRMARGVARAAQGSCDNEAP